jgi:putative molybdopterin biosynthesis protein
MKYVATRGRNTMKDLLSTREVAKVLGVNEKMVYTLVSEKGLPASKVTGKWLFPRHLVDQWLEAHTVNYPENSTYLPHYKGLLVIAGSNDLLLDTAMTLFNRLHPGHVGRIRKSRQHGGHCRASAESVPHRLEPPAPG